MFIVQIYAVTTMYKYAFAVESGPIFVYDMSIYFFLFYLHTLHIMCPSPRFKKWSGGRHRRVPKAREGESTRGGSTPSRKRGSYMSYLYVAEKLIVFMNDDRN